MAEGVHGPFSHIRPTLTRDANGLLDHKTTLSFLQTSIDLHDKFRGQGIIFDHRIYTNHGQFDEERSYLDDPTLDIQQIARAAFRYGRSCLITKKKEKIESP